jgi:hypothetical protein
MTAYNHSAQEEDHLQPKMMNSLTDKVRES